MKIFLTGDIGVGKSTVAQRIIDIIGKEAFGFKTYKTDYGFEMVDLYTGETGPVAHKIRRGKYSAVTETFDILGVQSLKWAEAFDGIVLMDELGRFELTATKFVRKVYEIIRGPIPVIVVIKDEDNEFLDVVRTIAEPHLFKVTPFNREKIIEDIIDFVENDVLVC